MAKKQTAAAAATRAEHLRKQDPVRNEKLANKWDRIARKVAKNEVK